MNTKLALSIHYCKSCDEVHVCIVTEDGQEIEIDLDWTVWTGLVAGTLQQRGLIKQAAPIGAQMETKH